MGKSLAEADLSPVVALLVDRPDGLSMRDLVGTSATEAQRRAMQRRLRKLIEQGRVRVGGSGKGTRYFSADAAPPTLLHAVEAQLDEVGSLFVPISADGQTLQKLLMRPQAEHSPVGYNRDFLSAYQPNRTFFLSPTERQHLAKVGGTGPDQPAGTYARQILDRLLIDLSWNSSRLEGNRYSILDTISLLEKGKTAEGKSAEETQMILNHKEAIEFLVDAANEVGFNRSTILNLHALLSNNLLPDAMAEGRLRRRIIEIGHSVYTPLQTPQLIEESFAEMLTKADAINDPFEQSLFICIQLPYLQPFEDVNKRVSRLAANIPFIKRNLSPVSFIDVPEQTYVYAMLAIYELNATELARDMFIWAYERSARRYAAIRQSIGQPDPFRLRYREELREIVAEVIRAKANKSKATKLVADYAAKLPKGDIPRFAELAETELVGLHEGNFARYRVRPSEFYSWKMTWE